MDAATTLAADAFADVFGERRGGYNNPRWTQAAPALQPLTICWNADAGRKLLLRVVAVGELMGPAMTRRYHAKKTVRVEIYDASALAIDFGSETANYADGFGIMLKSFTWHQMVNNMEGTLGLCGTNRRRRNVILFWLRRHGPDVVAERWRRMNARP